MTYKLKINIISDQVSLILHDKKKDFSKSVWTDKRDFSEKILVKIDKLLKNNNIYFSNLSGVDFECDSPYYKKKEKNMSIDENISSKNKCGFMSWQVGEITAKTMNLVLTNSKK